MLASMGKVGAKEASQVSKKLLGFDFIPLITSLIIFYVLAFLIAKFMEASILAKGGLMAFVNLLGYTVPTKEQYLMPGLNYLQRKALTGSSFGILSMYLFY